MKANTQNAPKNIDRRHRRGERNALRKGCRLAGIRVLQDAACIQQHRRRVRDVLDLDRGTEERAWNGNCNLEHGADRSLLVQLGMFPAGTRNDPGACEPAPCQESERTG